MKKNSDYLELSNLVINLYIKWVKPKEILQEISDLGFDWDIIRIYNIVKNYKDSQKTNLNTNNIWEVILEKEVEKLGKSKQRIQDQKNLLNKQIRNLNRDESFYEVFTEQLQILTSETIKRDKIKVKFNKKLEKKVTCVILSDTHADEVISKLETAWNEEFNFDIFQRRLRKLETEIIEKQKVDKSKYLSLFMLWDMLSWSIHPELYENAEAGKVELLYKTWVVISKFILNISSYFEKVYIQTTYWNHWRFDKAVKYKRTDENWDNILYLIIKWLLQKEDKIQFNISTQFLDSVKIENFKITYFHWDSNIDQITSNYEADLFLIWHIHTAKYNSISKLLSNWAFNKWNWWVSKALGKKTDEQHQVSFTLELDKNKLYQLWDVRFHEITKWQEDYSNYWITLTEQTILGWKVWYVESWFEILLK